MNFISLFSILLGVATAYQLRGHAEEIPCFILDQVYTIKEIDRVTATTVKECHNACLSNPDCGNFAYNSYDNDCFLKPASEERVRRDGRLSGLRDCVTSCFDVGILYEGDVVTQMTSSMPEECQAYCFDLDSCYYFSYDLSNSTCYLLSKIEKETYSNSVVSGDAFCDPNNTGRPKPTPTSNPSETTTNPNETDNCDCNDNSNCGCRGNVVVKVKVDVE